MSDKELIDRLLTFFYVTDDGEVHWMYIEGYPVNSFDTKLAQEMAKKINGN